MNRRPCAAEAIEPGFDGRIGKPHQKHAVRRQLPMEYQLAEVLVIGNDDSLFGASRFKKFLVTLTGRRFRGILNVNAH